MTIPQTGETTPHKPLRLWPGVVIVMLQWLLRFGVPIVVSEALAFGVLGGVLGDLAIVVWWAFLSRAPRFERWGAVVLMIVAPVATSRLLHDSIATGMMGMLFSLYAIPVLSLAFVVWAVASRRLSDGLRRATMVAAILLACGVWTLLRTDGITGDAVSHFAWRWAQTAEQRLLARASDKPTALPSAPAAPGRTGLVILRGPRATPALRDGRIYTFGATGILNALDASSGAVVWTRNAASDTAAEIPGWGFSSSPLVVDDLLIVAVAGRLAAYGRASPSCSRP